MYRKSSRKANLKISKPRPSSTSIKTACILSRKKLRNFKYASHHLGKGSLPGAGRGKSQRREYPHAAITYGKIKIE
jgi:hypothetical protein